MRVTADYNVLNVCDVGLTIEMVDTEDGGLIWSSFVYSRWGKINGNPAFPDFTAEVQHQEDSWNND